MCTNIEDFNRGCLLIMGRLYASFPRPVTIKIQELDAGPDALDEERLKTYAATMEFLEEEGYVRYKAKTGPDAAKLFSGARLTSKGLAALNRSPEALEPSRATIGDKVAAWGSDTIAGVASDAIRHAVAVILG